MIGFSGSPLERADGLRSDADALARAMLRGARLLRMDGLLPVLSNDGALVWDTLPASHEGSELVFLGLDGEQACFAPVPDNGSQGPAYARAEIWPLIAAMEPQALAIYAEARSLTDWHARHRFCAQCGEPTQLAKAGWQRDCEACGASHFPRTDPVVIMLVERDGELLLGRQSRFPTGMYSALAGFVEPGETIEEAVRREVHEETGIRVGTVRYVASQPWPFPSQLMIGCCAEGLAGPLTIDEAELEDARWFTREEVAGAMAGGEGAAFIPPQPLAIAHNLLDWWLRQA